jgi:hypothetical protein
MIYLPNLAFASGLDLNVESLTLGFWAGKRKNSHVPRKARISATQALPATEHVSPLCDRSQLRAQGGHGDVTGRTCPIASM